MNTEQTKQLELFFPQTTGASPDTSLCVGVHTTGDFASNNVTETDSGVYGIFNTITGKWYIGQTNDLRQRKRDHFSALVGGYHHNEHLQSSFIKHGKNNFIFYIFESCSDESLLDEKERGWIQSLRTTEREFGYNSEDGGNLHKHLSEETKRKVGLAQLGRKRPPFTILHRQHISESRKGKTHKGWSPSPETRRKIALANKGKRRTQEQRYKLSLSRRGRRKSEEARKKQSLAFRGKPIPKLRGRIDLIKPKLIAFKMSHPRMTIKQLAKLFNIGYVNTCHILQGKEPHGRIAAIRLLAELSA